MRLPSVDLIDYQDSRPIYEQISEKYKILILKGVNTVQRAYSELERQGFLYSVKGKGNFVSPNPHLRDLKKKELLERLRALLKESEDSGIPASELLSELRS